MIFATALSKLTGKTKIEAVICALSERLERERVRVKRARSKRRLADELEEIALHCSSLPVRDPRSADEIIGYGEKGVPRR